MTSEFTLVISVYNTVKVAPRNSQVVLEVETTQTQDQEGISCPIGIKRLESSRLTMHYEADDNLGGIDTSGLISPIMSC